MSDLSFRQLFKPIQPAVKSTNEQIRYTELLPAISLSNYIYCYWRLKSAYKLSTAFSYRVIPDGCIDIFFNMDDPQDSRVMGFSTIHTEFPLDLSFHYVGVRFMPSAFPTLFNVNASEITNRDESLDQVVPAIAKGLAHLLEGQSDFQKIKDIFDAYFLKKPETSRIVWDRRLHDAILVVLKTHGTLSLKNELKTGISPRQLRRVFEFYIGNSPKMFSKVIRFQYFFQLLSSSKGQEYHSLFYEAGYYDQPHFNRDFKTFFGLTPAEALNR